MKPISTGTKRSVQDLLYSMVETQSQPRRVTDMDPSSTMHEGCMKYQDGGVISPSDPTDPKKLKKGIAWVESNNNPSAMNPTTSATGQYQQMYKSLVNEPEMTYEGPNHLGQESSNLVSRDSLANNPALQELLMDRSVHEGIGGRSLIRHGRELTQEYKQQLGDKWNFREDEVAALSHFMGRDRTRQYFASIRDNTPFSIPGTNHTAEMYLKKYNEGINRK